eukprot:1561951-Pleurochrysis_carterae.AAC.1
MAPCKPECDTSLERPRSRGDMARSCIATGGEGSRCSARSARMASSSPASTGFAGATSLFSSSGV